MDKPADNGFAAAVGMVEGKWKIDILCELGTAPRRFGRLKQALSGVSEKMLAQQLRELEADGLVHRKVFPGPTVKVVYSLTERGAALNSAAGPICQWAEQFGLAGCGYTASPAS